MSAPLRSLAVALAAAAAACGAQAKRPVREFNGTAAFGYLRKQVEFGPRIPGTPAHEQTGDWILAQLRATADTVVVQEIPHRTPTGQTLPMRNFLARFRPQAAERILFLAHWDTRPNADQSANLGAQRMPVPGANDGASGVAVLLGVADILKVKPPTVGVDLLFVDGEDFGNFADSTQVLIGSRWFAAHQPVGYPPLFAVLFDMIGDKNLMLPYEQNSQAYAPEVVDRVWRVAEAHGLRQHFRAPGGPQPGRRPRGPATSGDSRDRCGGLRLRAEQWILAHDRRHRRQGQRKLTANRWRCRCGASTGRRTVSRSGAQSRSG